jgi:hypothetical protein
MGVIHCNGSQKEWQNMNMPRFLKVECARKYYFPLPFIDNILDAIIGHECYPFLDGFLGYNQISIVIIDQTKTTFTIDWGTSSYIKMPFGLCNALSTFQKVMMTTFENYL